MATLGSNRRLRHFRQQRHLTRHCEVGFGKFVAEFVRTCGLDKQRDLFAGDTLEIYDPRYFYPLATLGKLSA